MLKKSIYILTMFGFVQILTCFHGAGFSVVCPDSFFHQKKMVSSQSKMPPCHQSEQKQSSENGCDCLDSHVTIQPESLNHHIHPVRFLTWNLSDSIGSIDSTVFYHGVSVFHWMKPDIPIHSLNADQIWTRSTRLLI